MVTSFKKFITKWEGDTSFLFWVYAFLLHTLENPINGFHPLLILAFSLLIWQRSEYLKFAFVLFYTISILTELPKVANHSIIALFINIFLLVNTTHFFLKDKKMKVGFDHNQRGMVIVILSLVYFFAFFHKLNHAYLELNLSCATQIYQKLLTTPLGFFLPNNTSVYWFNIYGSLFLEGLFVFLFFIFPTVGILLGFIFHSFLSFGMLYDFGAVIFSLYFILSDHFEKGVVTTKIRWGRSFLYFSLIPLLFVNVFKFNLGFEHHTLTTIFFVLGSSFLLLPELKFKPVFYLKKLNFKFLHSVLIVLFVLNGLSPYLGLKTISNFSMFSNLRVEGKGSNHLLVNDELEITSYNDDIAWIISAEGPPEEWVFHKGIGIPFMELRRVVTELRLIEYPFLSISYLRGDKLFQFDNALGERSELPDLPFWQRKLLGWREVRRDGVEVCRW